ncbi:MAG: alanine or glycine:cation symporter, AGCS family [Bacteroidetes bacterium HLUCCA01]|nr:MAG: alanine or glycine:cation symporter, AGCS family [Bacteroidetes bacterium HLUCCA01]
MEFINSLLDSLEHIFTVFANYAWGTPLLVLLVGGGTYFVFFSKFRPYRYIAHSIGILTGKYDDPNTPGDINHFQALSTALAATVGMGNISGVAIAITVGGPGAIFWMWVSAVVGMMTKFYTCTLAVMFRGKDSAGKIQGGPMYVIREGLGEKWKPLAAFFAICGLIGCAPMFQSNQLTQIVRDMVLVPTSIVPAGAESTFMFDSIVGLIIVGMVSLVIFGGIKRIGTVASSLVPMMVVLYSFTVLYIILANFADVPYYFSLILTDAFTGQAVAGGAVGEVIRTGIRRAAFSNEAGIGTEAMAHGAARTKEPVREGLVAMLEPVIDTIIVCTMTALAILMTGVWTETGVDGVTLTAMAFSSGAGKVGVVILVICVLIFSMTTMFTYSYYGTKCLGYLLGAEKQHYYNYFYVFTIWFGAVASIDAVINLIDGMFAMMAIPTMVSALILAPKVRDAAKDYFARYDAQQIKRSV